MSLIVINELSSRVRYHTLKIATTRILVSSSVFLTIAHFKVYMVAYNFRRFREPTVRPSNVVLLLTILVPYRLQ